jgi:hypothetical protein
LVAGADQHVEHGRARDVLAQLRKRDVHETTTSFSRP